MRLEKRMNLSIDGDTVIVSTGILEFIAIAFDGCHKIYLCEDENDIEEAESYDYEIHEPLALHAIWEKSCDLRFINTWRLENIVEQFADEIAIKVEEV